jgi:alkanesulfonate monooxygenase SsuD/methylene tetrahydromethanopterin reductase-like flavin-dependent oxidoreductase (luciferase family)
MFSFLAAHTEKAGLCLLVTGVTYRHPGLLAKIVTSLDVVSGGRARLAIGAAWHEQEHRALGVPFPLLAERFERLEETIEVCLQLWSDDNGAYEGHGYQLTETLCSPPPLRRPRPPILISGEGERKTVRLVAASRAGPTPVPRRHGVSRKLGVDVVWLVHRGDPVAFIQRAGCELISPLASCTAA